MKNTPTSEGSVWNRDIHVVRNSIIALCLCGIIGGIGLLGMRQANEEINVLAVYVLGGALGWILAPLTLLYEELFPPK